MITITHRLIYLLTTAAISSRASKGCDKHVCISVKDDDLTHRVVYSPHKHAEQGIAGTEELHFLSNKVLFLGLRFTRNRCGDAAG